MANPDRIPGGGATNAKAGTDLREGFMALFKLCEKVVEGDKMAESDLEELRNAQLRLQARLKAEEKTLKEALKAMTGGEART